MQVISYDWDESFHWDFDFRIPDIYLQIILLDRLIYVVGLPPPFLQSCPAMVERGSRGRGRDAGFDMHVVEPVAREDNCSLDR
jgi:hypothetical protein